MPISWLSQTYYPSPTPHLRKYPAQIDSHPNKGSSHSVILKLDQHLIVNRRRIWQVIHTYTRTFQGLRLLVSKMPLKRQVAFHLCNSPLGHAEQRIYP